MRRSVGEWLKRDWSFDGIFAASVGTAISVIGALEERKLVVPAQVKVVGYSDIALAEHVHRSLSSIRQPAIDGGKALVSLLLEAVAHNPKRTVLLPAQLIARESSQ